MYRRQKQQQWNKNQTEMHSVGGGEKIGKDWAMLTHCMQNIYVDKSSLLLWIRCISNKLNLWRKLSQNQEPGYTLAGL